ncbi:unnamed protein product [Leptidea sinapis]|uniref:Uncharacterized protein n=1 Tax=Leptidea sinapis TaxID=189913 RepID=A0A5E4QVW2_9NEOP|nr:unnamed protein product [Leptidea sinapis]
MPCNTVRIARVSLCYNRSYTALRTCYDFKHSLLTIFIFTMSRHVLLSRLAEQFEASSPQAQRFPSPERSVSPHSPTSTRTPPHSPDLLTQRRLDLLQLGDIEIAGRALKQYARATELGALMYCSGLGALYGTAGVWPSGHRAALVSVRRTEILILQREDGIARKKMIRLLS